MEKNIKDILSNLSTDVDQEKLLEYLQGKLSADQHHDVEKYLTDNDFDSDAMEGLQEIKDKKQVSAMVDILNRDLKKKTEKKLARRERMKLKDQSWLFISVFIILLLIVLSYFVIHYLSKRGHP